MFIFIVLIAEKEEKDESERTKSRKNRMDSDYASLFDRMTDTNTDSKYSPENAIIRSSMSSSSTTTTNNNTKNHSKQYRKILTQLFFFFFVFFLFSQSIIFDICISLHIYEIYIKVTRHVITTAAVRKNCNYKFSYVSVRKK